jgi:hypothetical protein
VLLRLPHRRFVFTQDACASRNPRGSDRRCPRRSARSSVTTVAYSPRCRN